MTPLQQLLARAVELEGPPTPVGGIVMDEFPELAEAKDLAGVIGGTADDATRTPARSLEARLGDVESMIMMMATKLGLDDDEDDGPDGDELAVSGALDGKAMAYAACPACGSTDAYPMTDGTATCMDCGAALSPAATKALDVTDPAPWIDDGWGTDDEMKGAAGDGFDFTDPDADAADLAAGTTELEGAGFDFTDDDAGDLDAGATIAPPPGDGESGLEPEHFPGSVVDPGAEPLDGKSLFAALRASRDAAGV